MSTAAAPSPWVQPSRRRIVAEVLIVLGLSLGLSAVYSVVNLINLLTRETPLSQQTATLNQSLSSREIFDLVYQLLGIFFDLVPVALVAYLLWQSAAPHLGRLGVRFDRPARDAGWGLVLALCVGIPGLVFYFVARYLGLAVNVVPTGLDDYWWTIPVLLFSALRAAVVEEFIAVGYLFARFAELGWGRWRVIVTSALIRGSYHLYQGPGAFIANTAMGVLFGWLYTKYGRLLPLVVTHFALDAAVFIGYPWAAATFPALFNI